MLVFMFCCSLVYIRLIHYELPNNKTHTTHKQTNYGMYVDILGFPLSTRFEFV